MLCTSEQVSAGHPDKICDQISDAIVTDCLRHDKNSRVAAECLIKNYEIIIAGEITSAHRPDFKALARGVLRRIGLPGVDQYRVTALISQQSPDIALGVDADGAGDQGMKHPPSRKPGAPENAGERRANLDFAKAKEAIDALSPVVDEVYQLGSTWKEALAGVRPTTTMDMVDSGLTLTVFRDEDWLAMVDHLTVRSATDVTMTFKDGTEIRA